jgi:DNA invertase Pin-like site-specific DNA recombinase
VWGGSAKGRRLKVTAEQEAIVARLKGEGVGVSAIARTTGLSRPTVYRVLVGEAAPVAKRGARRASKVGGGSPAEPPGEGVA